LENPSTDTSESVLVRFRVLEITIRRFSPQHEKNMTIWNLGGINADYVYSVPHIPAPGETLDASNRRVFLGGKGANMSVAAARAGTHVRHIGAVGSDGRWAVERLMEYGVDPRTIAEVETETAHAVIFVADDGENGIVVYPGANRVIPENTVKEALTQAETGDWFVTQNEVNLQLEGAKLAHEMGLNVAYVAAPFEQLKQATGQGPQDLDIENVVVTLGADGAMWFGPDGPVKIAAVPVTPIDTTGAGDTFAGYVLAGLDRGQPMHQALDIAAKAAAIMVTRRGTADVIPDLSDVQGFSVR